MAWRVGGLILSKVCTGTCKKKIEYHEKGKYFCHSFQKGKPIYYINSLHLEWNISSLYFLNFLWLWLTDNENPKIQCLWKLEYYIRSIKKDILNRNVRLLKSMFSDVSPVAETDKDNFLDLVRTLAAAFCTICSLFIESSIIKIKTKKNLEMFYFTCNESKIYESLTFSWYTFFLRCTCMWTGWGHTKETQCPFDQTYIFSMFFGSLTQKRKFCHLLPSCFEVPNLCDFRFFSGAEEILQYIYLAIQ